MVIPIKWDLCFLVCTLISSYLTHTPTHQLLISRLIAFISSRPVIYWFGKIKVIMDRELAILETAPRAKKNGVVASGKQNHGGGAIRNPKKNPGIDFYSGFRSLYW